MTVAYNLQKKKQFSVSENLNITQPAFEYQKEEE